MLKRRVCFFLSTIEVIVVLLGGCSGVNSPPAVTNVQEHYLEYSKDIQTVTDYLMCTGYEDAYITADDGVMIADLKKVSIEEPDVLEAIKRIFDHKAYRHINKNGHTVSLLQWIGARDIGCGIAYADNGEIPEIEFLTRLTPISDGWFYYVSDYNTWRDEQGPT